jgi:hypothetical protein
MRRRQPRDEGAGSAGRPYGVEGAPATRAESAKKVLRVPVRVDAEEAVRVLEASVLLLEGG